MNLEKIGKFIAKKRTENNFTQESLAGELDVSSRAISKWERGACLPDANNMAKLCKLFDISYNELLSGEEFDKNEYAKRAEEILEEFSKVETAQNKKFLMYEVVIGGLSVAWLILLTIVVGLGVENNLSETVGTIAIILGAILLVISASFCIKIETEAGKYECKHCGHRYMPKYSTICFAMHMGRTRYMSCPKCHKKSWQKKVV